MGFLKFLEKTYAIWYLTCISRMFDNKFGNIIDRDIDSDHDDKNGQLAWAQSGSEKINIARDIAASHLSPIKRQTLSFLQRLNLSRRVEALYSFFYLIETNSSNVGSSLYIMSKKHMFEVSQYLKMSLTGKFKIVPPLSLTISPNSGHWNQF